MVKPTKTSGKHAALKKNPLRNLGAMLKLNPYAKAARRAELLGAAAKAKAKQLEAKRAEKKASKKVRGGCVWWCGGGGQRESVWVGGGCVCMWIGGWGLGRWVVRAACERRTSELVQHACTPRWLLCTPSSKRVFLIP